MSNAIHPKFVKAEKSPQIPGVESDMEKDEMRPLDETEVWSANGKTLIRGTYQIWYRGKTHAVNVEATGVRQAWRTTKVPPERWKHTSNVMIYAHNPRATMPGDVIVSPEWDAWEVEKDGFTLTVPPGPLAAYMARHGIESPMLKRVAQWTRCCREAIEAYEWANPNLQEIDLDTW
jgi:hypothetical protein